MTFDEIPGTQANKSNPGPSVSLLQHQKYFGTWDAHFCGTAYTRSLFSDPFPPYCKRCRWYLRTLFTIYTGTTTERWNVEWQNTFKELRQQKLTAHSDRIFEIFHVVYTHNAQHLSQTVMTKLILALNGWFMERYVTNWIVLNIAFGLIVALDNTSTDDPWDGYSTPRWLNRWFSRFHFFYPIKNRAYAEVD